MSTREAILEGVSEAARVKDLVPQSFGSAVDVTGVIVSMEIPVLFRPLRGLWGATVSVGEKKGILVNSKIGRPVQRFTLAHELGHVVMGHELSFDESLDFSPTHSGKPDVEVSANAFAAELLASPTLIKATAKRHGWSPKDLTQPGWIYQLSLRLGISFAAACWTLAEMKVVSRYQAQMFAEAGPKSLKHDLVSPSLLDDPWADVWVLTEADSLGAIEAGPFDVFKLVIRESVSSGFQWEFATDHHDYTVVEDYRVVGTKYGSLSDRIIVLKYSESARHRLLLRHVRPWNEQVAQTFLLDVDTRGKETGGLPRRIRESLMAAVA